MVRGVRWRPLVHLRSHGERSSRWAACSRLRARCSRCCDIPSIWSTGYFQQHGCPGGFAGWCPWLRQVLEHFSTSLHAMYKDVHVSREAWMPGATSASPHLIQSRLQGAPALTGKTIIADEHRSCANSRSDLIHEIHMDALCFERICAGRYIPLEAGLLAVIPGCHVIHGGLRMKGLQVGLCSEDFPALHVKKDR